MELGRRLMISSILNGAMDGKVVFRRQGWDILANVGIYYINNINWIDKYYTVTLIGRENMESNPQIGVFKSENSRLYYNLTAGLSSGSSTIIYEFFPDIDNNRLGIETSGNQSIDNPLIIITEYDPV